MRFMRPSRATRSMIDGPTSERGRTTSTAVVALLTIALLAVLYFWSWHWPSGPFRDFLLAVTPSFIVVMSAFVFIVLSKGLGLWGRGDKLDAIVEFLDGEMHSRQDQVRVFHSTAEVPWGTVFDLPGPVRVMANFSVQPLVLGAESLRTTLAPNQSGHLFIFMDPEADAAHAELAASRSRLAYANDPDGVRRAIRETVALLVELMPREPADLDRPPPRIRVLLTSTVLPFTAYWTPEWAVVVSREVSSSGLREAPRIVTRGDASASMRAYNENMVATVIDDDPKEPSLRDLIGVALAVKDDKWRLRMERKFSRQ